MNNQLWSLAGPIRPQISASVVVGLLVTAAYIAQGLLLATALSYVLAAQNLERAAYCIAGLAVVLLARGGLLWLSEVCAQRTAQATKETMRERLLAKLLELGPAFANARQSGGLQQTIVGGVEAIETYFSRYMPSLIVAVIGTVIVLGCLAILDPLSALVLTPFVVALPIFSKLWRRWRGTKSSKLFAVRTDFGTYLLDSLQGLVTLKAFSATVLRRVELVRKAIALRLEAMRTLSVSLMRSGITGLMSMGGVAVLLSLNSWRLADGQIAPIILFATLFLAREVFRPLDRLEREFHAAHAGVSAAGPIAELLASEALIREPATPERASKRSDVSFENVTFAYDGADRAALDGGTFNIGERKRVALVGPSGAGKTTVASLLLRFFDPAGGTIRIGGVDICDMRLEDLRAQIALVAQDTFLFHGTIADNLRIAKPDASDAEIKEAAAAAQIDDFISGLPNGYDTEVGERGTQLSGGQRQRIAIARALLKNAPILILDEATSSVDPASEQAIQAAFDALFNQRTTIVIAHRLSTIRNCDAILVFNQGSVVEHGTHDDLVSKGGLYAKLTSAQQGMAA